MSEMVRRQNPEQKTSRGAAFTLVELLVVVAIITVLISMLLPALNAALRASRTIGCQSNLRQIATWGVMYAQDNNGYLPVNGDTLPSTTGWYPIASENWPGLTSTYSGYWRKAKGVSAASPPGAADTGVLTGNILICPEAFSSVEIRPFPNGYTYGLNTFLGGRKSYTFKYATETMPTPKLGLLNSSVFWFGDGSMSYKNTVGDSGMDFSDELEFAAPTVVGTSLPWTWPVNLAGGNNYIGHGGQTANFVFGDGHVDVITEVQYLAMSPGGSSNSPQPLLAQFTGFPY